MDVSAEILRRPPPAYSGMRIGLLGGSFDPPHDGHRHISLVALKRLQLDRLWWLVTPGNPLKSPDARKSFARRLELARLWARHARIDVTGFEARHPDPFTVHTLTVLKRRFPGVAFTWIMGADNLATFHRWRGWRDIANLVPIAVIDRPSYRYKALSAPAAKVLADYRIDDADVGGLSTANVPVWTLLNLRLADISSTEIREKNRPD